LAFAVGYDLAPLRGWARDSAAYAPTLAGSSSTSSIVAFACDGRAWNCVPFRIRWLVSLV